jgi:adenylosuccinate lyase
MIDRYTRTKMKRIWSDQNKFKAWLDVELAAVKAWEEFGRIPAGTYDRIVKKAKFTVKGIQDFEKKTNHDVVAFTTDVATYVGDDSKWIHLGLT